VSFRYRIKNEVDWSSGYSPQLDTFSAVVPTVMTAPTTAIDGLNVAITWVEPHNGGLAITAYQVFIRSADNSYLEETVNCAVNALTCSVPLLELQDESTFGLTQGTLVQVRVQAVNDIGAGLDGSQNTVGALIETVPHAPPVAPQRNSLTTEIQVVVDYMAMTGTADGGTTVTSYELWWNQGDNIGSWEELVGGSSDSLLNRYTVYDVSDPTLVESGQSYSFKYRAKNRQGTGEFSGETSIVAANEPDQLTPVVTTMNGASVRFSWSISDQPGYSSGGLTITAYDLQIQKADLTFTQHSNCLSTATLVTLFCEVPMSELTDTSGDFSLPLGTLILAQVSASNDIGASAYSSLNTVGELA
jgi:hypothetical protein